MAKSKKTSVERRDFLKSAIAGAATIAVPAATLAATAKRASAEETAASARSTALMAERAKALLIPPDLDPPAEGDEVMMTTDIPGCDFMVDVIKTLGFEYLCCSAGSSFRALQESIVNYGGNRNPEFITCLHEESSVGMAHGYAKMEGKPVLVFAHGTVGLQHAAMGIYNAYVDRVPVFMIVGNSMDADARPAWEHSAQDCASMVRDYTKWDDNPVSLQHFAESCVRAYKIMMTPPMEPVLVQADTELQEAPNRERDRLKIPKLTVEQPPQGDSNSVREAARLLVHAENPVIIVDKYSRTQAGVDQLVELADLIQAPVVDEAGRMNFPSLHHLNHSTRRSALVSEADVVMGLETQTLYRTVNAFREQVTRTIPRPIMKPNSKLISITANDLFMKANYQDQERYQAVDLAMAADAETTMPAILEEVKRQITSDRKAIYQARGAKLADAHLKTMEKLRDDASYAWDASPVSTARLSAELWEAVKDEDWSFVSYIMHFSWWPLRTWPMEKRYHFNGGPGGNGMGYNAPASLGAALANKKHGRFTVNIQCDGDLLYAPGVLWTAAHHRIPILNVMHNNRAYHQEIMHVQRMANRHNRGINNSNVTVGLAFNDPNIDFAKLAASMGMYSEGPISDPNEVGPALKRAVAVVKRGEPVLLDVVTQPR